ncbi:hypothetical protein Tco_1278994, partial [Tanacetum coccineum]
PTTALDMALELMSKAFQLNNITPTNNNQRSSLNPCYSQIAQSGHLVGQNAVQNQGTQNVGNQNGLSVILGITNQHGNVNFVAARAEGNSNKINGNQLRCYNYRGEGHYASNCTDEAGIQLNSEEFDFMAAACAYDEIRKVTANYILQDNLRQASTSGTQSDKAPVYDSDGSAEVHHFKNCYDNDILNIVTQKEHYTKLLEPIPELHQVQQNDSNVISAVSSVKQNGGTVEQHPANVEETRVLYVSLYNNLAIEVDGKVPFHLSFVDTSDTCWHCHRDS